MGHDTLSALDATFLELEDADASAHMHIGAMLVFDALPDGGAPDLGELRAHLDSRLAALPRYRQRLSATRTGGLTWPEWLEDERFDIARHVRRAVAPAPGGWAEVLEWAEDFYAQRLDRTGPLWEMVLLEGLEHGRWALCTKTHHAIVDGVGSVAVAHLLLDTSATPPARRAGRPKTAEPGDEGPALPGWIPAHLLTRAVRGGVDLARHPSHAGDLARRAIAVADLLVRDEVRAAPASSLNVPIGGRRRMRSAQLGLDEARLVKNALGGTINDVILAGVTGGLRALLLSRGEQPPAQGLRAMVPVNLRTEDEHDGRLGNRVTSLFIELPVDEATPLARYERLRERTAAMKASDQAMGSDALLKLTGLAPPVLHSVLAQSLFASRLFNVTVTNVPGPQLTLYAMGAALRDVCPVVPLAAEHAIGVAITSYDGRLSFGIVADYDTVPDIDVMTDGLVEALAELERIARAAATGGTASSRAAARG